MTSPHTAIDEAAKPQTRTRSTLLPFHRAWLDERDIEEVVDTLRSGWLTMGPKTVKFEEAFARHVSARHAVAVNSCTAALHLALDVAGIQPGDEVITSVFTFTATAATIMHLKAVPVLVDVLPSTLCMDPAEVERKITPRTRAIVPVHFAGAPAEMDPILDLAARHRLLVVEDAAHALPTRYRGRLIGSLGDLTCFSFYASKNLTTGEGGMVTTEREDLAARLRTRRLHGMTRDAWKRYTAEGSWYYEVEYPGYKYNMTDINAALGLQQLAKLDMFHAVRTYYALLYQLGLADLPELVLPEAPPHIQHAWHLYPIRLRPGALDIDRGAFITRLREENIATSVHFIPLHLHPHYRTALGHAPGDFPVALQAYEGIVSLPLYPRMTEADVWDVVHAVRRVVERHRVRRSA
jgi:dTDP-4-amino-4,6-dideoxygalactose transaminase